MKDALLVSALKAIKQREGNLIATCIFSIFTRDRQVPGT